MPKKRPAAQRRPKKPRPKVKRRRNPSKNGMTSLTGGGPGVRYRIMTTGVEYHPIRAWILAHGKTVQWLADQSDYDRTTVEYWISGRLNFSDRAKEKIAKVMSANWDRSLQQTLEFLNGPEVPLGILEK